MKQNEVLIVEDINNNKVMISWDTVRKEIFNNEGTMLLFGKTMDEIGRIIIEHDMQT